MKRNVLFGVGAAILLILGVWVWQSVHTPEPRTEETQTRPANKPELLVETPSPTPARPEATAEADGESCSVSGTVRMESTGSPVVGASVKARNGSIPFESPLAYTDEKGSYTLTDIPAGIHLRIYYVNCPSGEYYQYDGVSGTDGPPVLSLKPGEQKIGVNINVVQGQSGSISGIVVGRNVHYYPPCNPDLIPARRAAELAEEVALSGVKVVLEEISSEKQETVTDKKGCFRFEKLKQAIYMVSAEVPEGFAYYPNGCFSSMVNLFEKPVQDEVKLCFLKDGVSIEGRVLDSKGHPLEGVEITAFQSARPAPVEVGFRELKVTTALSNASGEFRLSNLPVSSFDDGLRYLRKGDYYWEFRLRCEAQGFCPAQIALPPFSDALIQSVIQSDEETVRTAPKEIFGALDLQYADVKLPGGQGDVISGVEIVLSSCGSVSGRVVDKQGRNLLSADEEQKGVAYIELIRTEGDSAALPLNARLEEGSRFHIENVSPGRYNLHVGWSSYLGIRRVNVRAKNEPLVIQEGETIQDLVVVAESMANRGDIAGHVVDALTAQPVESLSVKILRVDSPIEPEPQKGQVSTDNLPVGDFSIRALSAGKVTLELAAPGYKTIQVEADVSSGQTTEQTFQMGEGGGLSGLVLDAETKEPVETFEVKVFPGEEGNESKSFEGKVRKDEEKKGAFYLSGLPAGDLRVEISNVPDRSNLTEEVEIVSGKMTERTFLIQRKGTLIGRITKKGEKAAGADVSTRIAGEAGEKKVTVQTNGEGDYKLEGLNSGENTVLAILKYTCGFHDGTRVQIIDRAQVEIKSGSETRQDFDFQGNAVLQGSFRASDRSQFWFLYVLEGTVPACEERNPVLNGKIRVIVWNLQEGESYEIRPLPSGPYTLFARCYKGNDFKAPVAEKIQTITLTDGQALTVDFELP